MSGGKASPARATRRLDQWLWFARFVKSRSLAAQLCTAGAVTVNGLTVSKANHMVRIGDAIALPQGALCRTVRVLALGWRRGPAAGTVKLSRSLDNSEGGSDDVTDAPGRDLR